MGPDSPGAPHFEQRHLERKNSRLHVIDLLLPGIDGFEVLRNLRTGRPELVGIAVTALVGQEELAYQAGFNAYLTKPVEPWVLAREIARRVGR